MKVRQKKKNRKNSTISMDIISLPKNMEWEKWYYILKNARVIMWDSSLGGLEPKIYPVKNKTLYKIKDDSKINKG
jgi:hypothetical protein